MTYTGPERRSSLTVTGPWGLRLSIVSAWSALWCLVGMLIGIIVGVGISSWTR